MIKIRLIRWCIILSLLVLVIAGCSGSNENNPPIVSGVAAAGSVLVGTVYLRDSSVPAKEFSMPLAADGSFLFNLNGLNEPYVLKALGTANGRTFTLYSVALTAGIANINPLSSLAMTLASDGDYPQNLFDDPSRAKILVTKDSLSNAIASVQTALRPTLARFGAETVNFISDTYLANHKGIDLFLDNATISTDNSNVSLFDRTTSTGIQTTFSDFKAGSFDFIANPVMTVGTVCISSTLITANANESINFSAVVIGATEQNVTWSVVEDNGGSITNSGVYTAPATGGTYHVKATSTADSTKSATATIVVRPVPIVNIVLSGPGEYSVIAGDFFNVAGAEVTITYDTNILGNPRITQGALLAGTFFLSNLYYTPRSLKFTAMSLSGISGSGSLAAIKFDLLGAAPNAPEISALKISSAPPAIHISPSSPTAGDVNGDGVVRLADSLQVMRHIIGTQPPLTPSQLNACDVASSSTVVTPDGVCDVVDAVMILNRAYGIIIF